MYEPLLQEGSGALPVVQAVPVVQALAPLLEAVQAVPVVQALAPLLEAVQAVQAVPVVQALAPLLEAVQAVQAVPVVQALAPLLDGEGDESVQVLQAVESGIISVSLPIPVSAQRSPQSREDLERGKLLKLFSASAFVGAVGYVVSTLVCKIPGKVGNYGLLLGVMFCLFGAFGIALSVVGMACNMATRMFQSCKRRCSSEEENVAVEPPQEAAQARLH